MYLTLIKTQELLYDEITTTNPDEAAFPSLNSSYTWIACKLSTSIHDDISSVEPYIIQSVFYQYATARKDVEKYRYSQPPTGYIHFLSLLCTSIKKENERASNQL